MSNTPERYILNSDYATLKNDSTGSVSITLVAGTVISAGNTYSVSGTVTLGQAGASLRAYMVASNDAADFCVGTFFQFKLDVNNTFSTFDYAPVANLEKISATEIRLYCNIVNFGGPNITLQETVTVTAYINTFLPPF